MAVAQSPSSMQVAARSATAFASRRKKSWYSSPERRTSATCASSSKPLHEVERALEQPTLEPRRAGGAQFVADHQISAVRGDPGLEARPCLDQGVMREFDTLGWVFERRQQSGLD